MFDILEEPFTNDYDTRINMLQRRGIALWDVIESCGRIGSLDSMIKDEVQNDISGLLHKLPDIKVIFCNGKKAYANLIRILPAENHLKIIALPSSSPAYTLSYESKLEAWSVIRNYLRDLSS